MSGSQTQQLKTSCKTDTGLLSTKLERTEPDAREFLISNLVWDMISLSCSSMSFFSPSPIKLLSPTGDNRIQVLYRFPINPLPSAPAFSVLECSLPIAHGILSLLGHLTVTQLTSTLLPPAMPCFMSLSLLFLVLYQAYIQFLFSWSRVCSTHFCSSLLVPLYKLLKFIYSGWELSLTGWDVLYLT